MEFGSLSASDLVASPAGAPVADPSRAARFVDGSAHLMFQQLRRTAALHHCPDSPYGPYWSLVCYDEMAEIEANPQRFVPGPPLGHPAPPAVNRAALAAGLGQGGIAAISGRLREATGDLLDALPQGPVVDWATQVAEPLTAQLFAIGLADVPDGAALAVHGHAAARAALAAVAEAATLWPEQWQRLLHSTDLAVPAAHELLRWASPVQHGSRIVQADSRIAGQIVPAGDRLVLWYVSANRDEEVFADGHRFVLERPNARRHLSFALGQQRCPAARLIEAQVFILYAEMAARRMVLTAAGTPRREGDALSAPVVRLPVRLSF